MGKAHSKFLLVEGKDDAYAVAGLMGSHVAWGDSEEDWPVMIVPAGSDTQLLDRSYLDNWFRRSGLEALGILLDANDNFLGRWTGLRNTCIRRFPRMPEELPTEGLILAASGAPRFGVWIMPDNRSRGMLETFLGFLVPEGGEELWDYAIDASSEARSRGAAFKDAHRDKAHVHTWLAWQDPPGRPFGEALKAKCLQPDSPAGRPFVEWFIRLFELEEIQA